MCFPLCGNCSLASLRHKCIHTQVLPSFLKLPVSLVHNPVSPFAYLAADSSDNSDLEDDIILSLNE